MKELKPQEQNAVPPLRRFYDVPTDEAKPVVIAEQSTKQWYQSKTMIFNILAILLIIIDVLIANETQFQPFLNEQAYQFIVMLLPIVNMILRSITSSKITVKKGDNNG